MGRPNTEGVGPSDPEGIGDPAKDVLLHRAVAEQSGGTGPEAQQSDRSARKLLENAQRLEGPGDPVGGDVGYGVGQVDDDEGYTKAKTVKHVQRTSGDGAAHGTVSQEVFGALRNLRYTTGALSGAEI